MALNQIIVFIADGQGKSSNRVRDFNNLTMDSNTDQAVETFSMTIIDPDLKIKTGYYTQIWLGENNITKKLLLYGQVQRKDTRVSKTSVEVTISGKNAASMLVESYVREPNDYVNRTPMSIIDALVDQTSFLSRGRPQPEVLYAATVRDSTENLKDFHAYMRFTPSDNRTWRSKNSVVYDDDFKALKRPSDTPPDYKAKNFKVSYGETIWEKISEIVTLQGYEAYYRLDGDLYIGDLNKERDNAGVNFSLTHRKNNQNNNVLRASQSEDISDRYPEIRVESQTEAGLTKYSFVTDETAPSASITPWRQDGQKIPGPEKTMTMTIGEDQDPEKIGIATREHQRINGLQISYDVPGFTQSNKIWLKNRLVKVVDDIFDINATLVIYGVTFNFNKTAGAVTTLRLSMAKDLISNPYPPGGTGEAEIVE